MIFWNTHRLIIVVIFPRHFSSLTGQSVGDRWQDIAELCRPFADDHINVLNDVHVLMAGLRANQEDLTDTLMNTLRDKVR